MTYEDTLAEEGRKLELHLEMLGAKRTELREAIKRQLAGFIQCYETCVDDEDLEDEVDSVTERIMSEVLKRCNEIGYNT